MIRSTFPACKLLRTSTSWIFVLFTMKAPTLKSNYGAVNVKNYDDCQEPPLFLPKFLSRLSPNWILSRLCDAEEIRTIQR